MNMTPEELFEEKQHLVFAAIKQQFHSHANAEKSQRKIIWILMILFK